MEILMKNIIFTIIALGLMGCSPVYQSGNIIKKYEIEDVALAEIDKAAIVKVTSGLFIWKIDQNQIVNKFDLNFRWGKRPAAVRVAKGRHTLFIKGRKSKIAIMINGLDVKVGHEYLVEYIVKNEKHYSRVFYWVKDLTTGQIVYGKRRTKEELEKLEN
jgi:hypothetical protein